VASDAALFQFDAVARLGTGYLGRSADITPGTHLYDGVTLNGGALSTATDHLVMTAADAVYEAQADGSLVFADTGMNANLILSAGSAVSGLSGHQINSATEDVTATLDVHLLGLLNVPDNAPGSYARFEIVFNKHRMAPAAVGV